MTFAHEKRDADYLAAQGYRKFIWEVVLHRLDTGQKYTPDDEAYTLPGVHTDLESDKYSIAIINRLNVGLHRTDDFIKFVTGLSDPRNLTIKVLTHPIFKENLKYAFWHGRLEKLPEGLDTFTWDSLNLTFLSFPGGWRDGDDVKDPLTSTYYKNKHVTDTVLPAFLKEALSQAGYGDYTLETPEVSGTTPFWTSSEIPHKKLARSDATFDTSHTVKGLCWDSSRSLLYMGISGAMGTEDAPWLVSYDPSTREWNYITEFLYTGGDKDLRYPTTWEVQHLEYSASADKVYFVCRTRHVNLLDREAHYKCKGEIDLTSVPTPVELTDTNLFTLHDKGVSIRSMPIYFDNRGGAGTADVPTSGGIDYYGDATTEAIGWGTPRHSIKECGPLKLMASFYGALAPNSVIERGSRTFYVVKSSNKANHPRVDDVFFLYDKTDGNGRKENLGKIVAVAEFVNPAYFKVTTKYRTRYRWEFGATPNAEWCICRDGVLPKDNIFIAEPQEIKAEYLYPEDVGSVDSETVYVEARKNADRGDNFYWPRDLGEITETGKFKIDRVGYTSFISIRALDEYKSAVTYKKHLAGDVAPFKITLKGYNPSYLIEDGFYTASKLQFHPPGHPCRNQAGPCRILHNGVECFDNEGRKVETYGNIYLFKIGSNIYAAWNAHGEPKSGDFFNKCRAGRWNGSVFVIVFTDRWGNDYHEAPEIYLKSATRYKDHFYFGTRYYEHNWIDTTMKIFYAIQPTMTNYDGSLGVTCVVKGDKTDVIQAGTLLRLRDTETADAKRKVYFVSEVNSETEYVGSSLGEGQWIYPAKLAPGEDPYLGQITSFSLLAVDGTTVYDATSYSDQIKREVVGRYISIAVGRDERHQIRKL